ncbi:MAG: FHA domain-containing protein [Verrucomicrobia bacterium]|nr:FHA domain-containing protein [Verrucomicrobiota bacterium]MBU1734182.1 FHA domain-containing protein [Verrucomicrobiota bacterium]MBU1856518.1 FHA domain-containing protein [Verrucomicrobiota bacterium]
MGKPQHHLVVEVGPDKGLTITVPPHGIRVGRSSNNDVVLKDSVMSRFHCRFFFKPDDGLWAEDLGSANQTLLNQAPMHVARLHVGDHLVLGDTTIKVDNDSILDATTTRKLFDSPVAEGPADGKIEFRHASNGKEPGRKPLRAALMTLLILLAAFGALLWIYKTTPRVRDTAESKPSDTARVQALSISYEKVQADAKNIFRYVLELEANELSIQITDLQNKRQVAGQQHRQVAPEILQSLSDTIEQADFFALKESYQGVATDVWDLIDLSVTINRKTHRVWVLNTHEPEACKAVREAIEEFGQNELGLAALAMAPEKLIDMARAASLLGRSLYDQREVKHDNLANAIRSLHEVEWYLETIEPKPDFYASAVVLRTEAEREMQASGNDLMFLAERAIRLKDWNEAALQLRLLCEKIPDRADSRHQNARKKLLAVERHLKTK